MGMIGAGIIGGHIVRRALAEEAFLVAFVVERDEAKARELGVPYRPARPGGPYPVDLVVEAAEPSALKEHALAVLAETDLLPFSLTAFADPEFEEAILKVGRRCRTRIRIPHGAIVGLDGLWDARAILTQVRVTSTKPPHAFGRADTARTVFYEGPARQACRAYPRNVNVHAAAALCGIGFDRTVSTLIADPDCRTLQHFIEAKAGGVDFSVRVASRSTGGVTGWYTPESAYQTVKRLCAEGGPGMRLA
ncbi:MAG: DUF108 domain-containing protein [bacterium]|nr:DUF108 domain-containing protein [bacterium]